MKFASFFLAALLLSTSLGIGETHAQEKGPLKQFIVAVVDMNAVLGNSLAAQSIREQMESRRKLYQAEIQKEEAELREGNQELARQRAILSPDAFRKEQAKFEERFVSAQRKMQDRKNSLEKARATAMNTVGEVVKDVITRLVKDNDITLLLRKEQTVFSDKGLNITSAVIKELNKALPKVDVFPAKKGTK